MEVAAPSSVGVNMRLPAGELAQSADDSHELCNDFGSQSRPKILLRSAELILLGLSHVRPHYNSMNG
jgi:hypothetical protein